MSAKDVLRKLIDPKWSIIDSHEEREGEAFSLTGTLIHDVNRQRFNFDFYSDQDFMVLKLLERSA